MQPLDTKRLVSDDTAQNGVRALNSIEQAIRDVFPQVTATASSATGGAATLPANPVGFLVVTLPSGATAKIPYYAS